MTESEIQEIITTVQPEVVDQEPVYGGFRPLQRRYAYANGVLIETIEYQNPATSDAWAAIKDFLYSEGSVDDLQVFRSWNVSDHPQIAGIYRRVDLLELKVDAATISLKIAVKHFTNQERTQSAPYSSKMLLMLADNETIIDVAMELQIQGAPAQMGERTYWDFLTGLGMTPYQLLDTRIPELDGMGRFHNIY